MRWTEAVPQREGYYWGASRKTGRLSLFRIMHGAPRSGIRKGQTSCVLRFDEKRGFVIYESNRDTWFFWPERIAPPTQPIPVNSPI